ncbi:excinuclease ABC subunit C, partial [Enterococcus hirae]
ELILSHMPGERRLLEEALAGISGHSCRIVSNVRGGRRKWLELAEQNAESSLKARLASQMCVQRRLEALQDELGLDQLPARLECFDISHT